MALPFFMTLTGQTQGAIEGYSTKTNHEAEIQCHALDQKITVPFDIQTGQITGMRAHGPVKITKSFDKASPLLFQAMVQGEMMTEVKFMFYRILPSGEEQLYYTIILSDATIVELHPYMLNVFDPDLARYDHLEDVSFTYSRVEWRWEPDGITASDTQSKAR